MVFAIDLRSRPRRAAFSRSRTGPASASSTWSASRTSSRSSRPRAARLADQHACSSPSGSWCSPTSSGCCSRSALNRTLKTRYLLRTLIFMPVVLSPIAVSYIWKFIFAFNGPLNQFLGAVGLESLQHGLAGRARPGAGLHPDRHGLAEHRLRHGDLPGRPRVGPGRARGGRRARRRRAVAAVPARHRCRSSSRRVAIATTLTLIQGLRVFDQVMALTGGGPPAPPRPSPRRSTSRPSATSSSASAPRMALLLSLIILVFAMPSSALTRDRTERRLTVFRYTQAHPRPRDPHDPRRVDHAAAVLDPARQRRSRARQRDPHHVRPSRRPTHPTLEQLHHAAVAGAARLGNICQGLLSSLIITAGSILGLVVLGSLAAYVLARSTRAGGARAPTTCSSSRSSCRPSSARCRCTSAPATSGLVGTPWGMILIYTGHAAAAVGVPLRRILPHPATGLRGGRRHRRRLRSRCSARVVFPLMSPATGTVAILAGLIVWNDFFTALIFLNGSPARPCRS